MVLYPRLSLYKEADSTSSHETHGSGGSGRTKKPLVQARWEEDIRRLDDMCGQIPTLRTLLVSLMTLPAFFRLQSESAVIESVRAISTVPKLTVEALGVHRRKNKESPEGDTASWLN